MEIQHIVSEVKKTLRNTLVLLWWRNHKPPRQAEEMANWQMSLLSGILYMKNLEMLTIAKRSD